MRFTISRHALVAVLVAGLAAVALPGCKSSGWSTPSSSWLSFGKKKKPESSSLATRPSSYPSSNANPTATNSAGTGPSAGGYPVAGSQNYGSPSGQNYNGQASGGANTQQGFYSNTYPQSYDSGAGGAAVTADSRNDIYGGGGYSQPSGGYGAQPTNYDAQPAGGYGAQPAGGYGAQPSGGYGAQPAGGYGAQPNSNYGQPSGGYGSQPTGGYGADTSGGYGAAGTQSYGSDAGAGSAGTPNQFQPGSTRNASFGPLGSAQPANYNSGGYNQPPACPNCANGTCTTHQPSGGSMYK